MKKIKKLNNTRTVSGRYAVVLFFGILFGLISIVHQETIWGNASSTIPPAIGSSNAPPGYSLVWADEFQGSSLDTTKWNPMNNSNFGSGNREDQCLFAANAAVSGGFLQISAQQQTVDCGGINPDTGNNKYFFTSAFLTTKANQGSPEKYAFTKGYIEARIRTPKGNPYWSAFWLRGGAGAPGWPEYGEFDIMELYGKYPDSYTGTLHYKCATGNCNSNSNNIYNLLTGSTQASTSNLGMLQTPSNFASYSGVGTTQYFRYGFLWEDDRITWYLNGRPIRSFDGKNIVTYITDVNGNVSSSAVVRTVGTNIEAVLPSFEAILNYPHTLNVNLSVGGAGPRYNGAYTGIENPDGNSYNFGNYVADNPGIMSVDYVRVYQLSTPPPVAPSDTIKPTVQINQINNPVKGTYTFRTDASDNVGVTNVIFYINGNSIGSDNSLPYTLDFNTVQLPDGEHTIYAVARDSAGNTGQSPTVTFNVLNSVNIQQPSPVELNKEVVNEISIGTASSSEPLPVTGTVKIAHLQPGNEVKVLLNGNPSTTEIDTKKLTNGKHIVEVIEDGESRSYVISVDNPWPLATQNHLKKYSIQYGALTALIGFGGFGWYKFGYNHHIRLR
jgi:beta-glucanase (GH16 family)